MAEEVKTMRVGPEVAFLVEGPIEDMKSDLFGFSNAVTVATRFFGECPRPVLFAVYGRSGSGRTSFLRLLQSQMELQSEVVALQFSARPFRNSTNIIRALLRKIETTLGIDDNRFAEMKRTSATPPSATDDAFDDWVDSIDKLRDQLEEIIGAALKSQGKEILFVTVDDLDLCNSTLKIQLIEFVAEFLCIDSLVLVVTLDRKQLISDYLGSHIFVAERQASLYLERIFPHSYTIPWVGEDQLIDYVIDALQRLELLDLETRALRRFKRMVEVYLRRAAVTPVKLVRELVKFSRMHGMGNDRVCLVPHALFSIAIKSQFPEVYRFLLDKGNQGHVDLKMVFDPAEDFSSAGFTVRYGRRLDRILSDSALRDLFMAYDSSGVEWEFLLTYLKTAAFVPSPY